MPTYRDFAMSLALGWAVSSGGTAARAADAVDAPSGQTSPTPAAEATKAIDLEVIRERYPDRTVKIERHVVQDGNLNYVNHGPWTMWDPSGTVLAKGEYWQGKRHGEWKRYYIEGADGHPQDLPGRDPERKDVSFDAPEFKGFKKPFTSSATFVEDKVVGTWSIADADGKTVLSIDLDRNVPQGKAVWYFASGNKQREVDFKQGAVDGEWREWDAEGNQLRNDHYIEGRRQAEAVTKFDSGEKSSEGTYLYAKESIAVDFDWWTGNFKMQVAGAEGKPIKQGKWNYWYEDGGKRCEAEYVDDKPVARHSWWYRNGQKECEGEFIDGRSQGTWTYWHENGQKAAQGDYHNGIKVGKWIRWSLEGKVAESKDHPYQDAGLQPVPTARTFQPSTVPAPVVTYPNPATLQTVSPAQSLQPVPSNVQVINPQSFQQPSQQYPQGFQPVPQVSRKKGGGIFGRK